MDSRSRFQLKSDQSLIEKFYREYAKKREEGLNIFKAIFEIIEAILNPGKEWFQGKPPDDEEW